MQQVLVDKDCQSTEFSDFGFGCGVGGGVVGAIVGRFQDDIAKATLLAIFLPVLAGLCRTIGAQSLACTLRGLSLSNPARPVKRQVLKETWLGLVNGVLTGLLAGVGMFIVASRHPEQGDPTQMAVLAAVAMALSCMVAGLLGAAMPLLLRKRRQIGRAHV